MTNTFFDTLTKVLATRRSRRDAIRTSGSGIAAGLAGSTIRPTAAQEATPADSGEPGFLFVQTASSGSFTPNHAPSTPAADSTLESDSAAGYLLTLEGHHGGTIYFSDRPERIFGDAPTDQFLDGLGFSPTNPPNAALVTSTDDGEPDVVVLELNDPTYDAEAGTITYGATLLADYEDEGLSHVTEQQHETVPETFGRASLFIDDCADLTTCYVLETDSVGPIPGGPYGACFSVIPLGCLPCNHSLNSLRDLCNNAYPACHDDCDVG